jgi:4-hydroxythreonine-4-phosphate dehydrogenase
LSFSLTIFYIFPKHSNITVNINSKFYLVIFAAIKINNIEPLIMEKSEKIVVGISIGDINGIGIEVILKAFQDKRMLDFCTPVIFGSTKTVSFHKKKLNIDTNLHGITSINQLAHNKVNLLNIWKEEVPI